MKDETKLWFKIAKEDYGDAHLMWKNHRYGPTAFYCQQAIEKLLKAHIVEYKNQVPKKIHDLVKLSEDAGIIIPDSWSEPFKEMSRHYFRVRYPDMNKKYYSRRQDVEKILKDMEEIFKWIAGQLKK